MMGGVQAAGMLNGSFGFAKIMSKCYQEVRDGEAKHDIRQDVIQTSL
jgi:hypothetical protein